MQESKQETQFRIGGVYRALNGDICRLSAGHEEIVAEYAEPNAWAKSIDGFGSGFRSLIDGRDMYPDGLPKQCGCRDLIPGELHQVDGQWVPLDAQEESDLPELVKNFQERELRKADPTPALLKQLRALVATQGANGNWNHDDYMCGLYNGLELALAMAEGRDPQYRTLRAIAAEPVSTAKPPIAGLTRVSAQDHRVGGWGFVR